MKLLRLNFTSLVIVLLTSLTLLASLCGHLALPARAAGGGNFSGFYRVSDATAIGDQVKGTFSARIFNSSGSDAVGATVTLKGPGAPHGAYATFYGVTVNNGGAALVSAEVTVPAGQYKQWITGQPPLLVIQSAGTGISTVQLTRGAVGQE